MGGEGGIKIYHLTIPKPQIPPDIAKNYKEVKVQWTKQLVATQQQKTEKIQKDTETMKAVADANRLKEVLQIDIQKDILQKEGEQKLSTLENEILKDRLEAKANVEFYAKKKTSRGKPKSIFQRIYSTRNGQISIRKHKIFLFWRKQSLGLYISQDNGPDVGIK